MPSLYNVINRVEEFDGDRLVVDLRQVELVQKELKDVGVAWTMTDSSEELGLGLLEPEEPVLEPEAPTSFIGLLSNNEQTTYVTAVKTKYQPLYGTEEPPGLDVLLHALRDRFAGRYAGWTPTIGKNRYVDDVESSPHIGGGGDPEPLTETEEFRLPPRTPSPGHRVRVGILDTKFFAHPDLNGRYLVESDALLGPTAEELTSPNAHAVFMAGLILHKAPNAELIVRSELDKIGTASSWAVAEKLMTFLNEEIAVLSMSFSCTTADHEPPLVLARAIDRLSPGVVLVAAAGNHGERPAPQPGESTFGKITNKTPSWPAAFDDVVAVVADSKLGIQSTFSPHDVPWVGLAATAENVPSTFLPGEVRIVHRNPEGGDPLLGETKKFGEGYAKWNGTSAAAAKVSGAIAALAEAERISVREAVNRLLTPPSNPSVAFVDITRDIRAVHVLD